VSLLLYCAIPVMIEKIRTREAALPSRWRH